MDYSAIDAIFSFESKLLINYSEYEIISFDSKAFAKVAVKRKIKRTKQVVRMGAKCAYCTRRGDYIFVGKPRENQFLPHVNIISSDLVEMTVDHIFPLGRGGRDTENNRQVLCLLCNRAKANNLGPPNSSRK